MAALLEENTGKMTNQEIELWTTRAEIAKKDPWYWLKYFTFTMDEHDPTFKFKPFLARACYRILCRAWREFDIVFMEKSRQMLISWIFCALFLHDTMFQFNRRQFFQSEKEDKSEALIARVSHLYRGVTTITYPFIGEWLPKPKMTGQKFGTDSVFNFPDIGSSITAIAQGADQIPSFTLSGLFADEMDLQPKFEKGYGAAAPAIQGGGRLWALGSAYGKTFGYKVLYGLDSRTSESIGPHKIDSQTIKEKEKFLRPPKNLSPDQRRWWFEKQLLELDDETFNSIPFHELVACVPGIDYWITAAGIDCLRFHYTADPYKDPVTENGRIWLPEMKRKFVTRAAFDQHMEMSRTAFEGRPVITNWEKSVFVPENDLDYDSELPLWTTHDFGTIVCLTLFAQKVPVIEDGVLIGHQCRILDEMILRNSDTPTLARLTVEQINRDYQRSWSNRHIKSYCDPNGDRQSETTSDKSLNTSIAIMNAQGLYPSNKKFGVKESTELIETVFSLELSNGMPAIQISPKCIYLIGCCEGGLRYPPDGKGAEGHYVKDGEFDHGGDGLRYLLANMFNQYALTRQNQPKYPTRKRLMDNSTGRRRGYLIKSQRKHDLRRGVH